MGKLQGWAEQGGQAMVGIVEPPGPPVTTISQLLGPAVVSANDFPGATMDVKVNNAHAALPASGGTIDARSIIGNQQWLSAVTLSKPTKLLLGTTVITSTVTSSSGALSMTAEGSSIQGLGPTVTILQTNNTSGFGINLIANKTMVRDMTVRGGCTAHCTVSGTAIGINSGNTSDVELDNVVVERWNNIGVNTGGGVANWRLSNMVIQDNYGDGMFFGGGTGHMISQSVMRNNGSNGVDINSDHTRVIDCDIYGNGYNVGGVVTAVDTNGIVITSVGQGVDGCQVIGCQVYSNIGYGIRIRADQSGSSSDHTIANNTVYLNGDFGIGVDTSIGATCGTTNDIMIGGNVVFANTANGGILVGGGSGTPCIVNRIRISNNQVTGNTGTGVFIAYGNDAQVTNNTSLNNTVAQLNLAGSTRTLDFANKTDATVNLCTLGNGTLALNTMEPIPPGSQMILTSPGNTELIWRTTQANNRDWGLYTDASGNFVVSDTVDNIQPMVFAASGGPTTIRTLLQLITSANTELRIASTGTGYHNWALFIDNLGNLGVIDETAGTIRMTFSSTGTITIPSTTTLNPQNFLFTSIPFASLGTPTNGTIAFCGDCNIANPCTGGGSGAIAKRLAGVWVCN